MRTSPAQLSSQIITAVDNRSYSSTKVQSAESLCDDLQIEGAQYAHLCTNMTCMHHRRAGYPFGMLVDFAADGAGYPIFCLSPLSIHSRNLHDDPRCSLVVEMPGWLGLSDARVTIFGDVYDLPDEMQARPVLAINVTWLYCFV
jgi:hypothetical protein